ncbi:MAG: M67 family metallopeptidase [Lachnospiraceae bacterium]|nr:M67 family metallopeptidase [Lachnospiraceae bacterium]
MISHRQYKITPLALEKMKAHLAGVYPQEGCGILAGDDKGSIEEIFSTGNITDHDRSSVHYEIDPLDVYELEKKAKEKGYSVLGFYHSHPDCEARMSSEDSEYMIPHMLYVIASVHNGKCGEIRGYIKDL